MIATKIPSVLQRPHGNSLSIERALKQVLDLLDLVEGDDATNDRVDASINDVETMLQCIERGDA